MVAVKKALDDKHTREDISLDELLDNFSKGNSIVMQRKASERWITMSLKFGLLSTGFMMVEEDRRSKTPELVSDLLTITSL